MTPFSGSSLLISLPGAEIGAAELSGSVIGLAEVLEQKISFELRAALTLVQDEAKRCGLPIQCVARPELYTHGALVTWLLGKLDQGAQHLCFSDGSTVKPIAGFSTHVFFYALGFAEPYRQLQRTARRVPELMAQICSQVNSRFVLGSLDARFRPLPVTLLRRTPLPRPACAFIPFSTSYRVAGDDAAPPEARGDPGAAAQALGARRLLYVAASETAYEDHGFARVAAELVQQACFDPASLVILRLPPLRESKQRLLRALAVTLHALRSVGVVIPRAHAPNLWLATEDLDEQHPLFQLLPSHLVVHESFDFWRYSSGFYDRLARVTVVVNARSTQLRGFIPADLFEIYGGNAARLVADFASALE